MTNDVKKTNLVGNCEHTREGLELARWEKKTHPGHCPVDNDKDRSPFLSSRPTGHKEVDLLVKRWVWSEVKEWENEEREWERMTSKGFPESFLFHRCLAEWKWSGTLVRVQNDFHWEETLEEGWLVLLKIVEQGYRISDDRSNVTESGLTSSCWRFVCWCCSNYFSCLTGYFTAKQK